MSENPTDPRQFTDNPTTTKNPPEGSHAVEIDDDADDDALVKDEQSYTTSLASSAYNYTYENNRRYHAFLSGAYIAPNDQQEQDRLDLKHHVFKLILGGDLIRAPIANAPQRILDIGTGTGIWAIDIADQYPSAEVIGIDLSPIQPNWLPPNCSFMVDNAEAEWPYKPLASFDLVHWRVMAGSIADWPALYRQAYIHVKFGGWIEVQEHGVHPLSDDDTVKRATKIVGWFELASQASDKFGKPMDVLSKHKQWMIDAGFVDVREDIYKVPMGRWAKNPKHKEIGAYFQASTIAAIESVSMALFTRVLGFSYEEAQQYMVEPREQLKDPSLHLYLPFHFIYGRKPESKPE